MPSASSPSSSTYPPLTPASFNTSRKFLRRRQRATERLVRTTQANYTTTNAAAATSGGSTYSHRTARNIASRSPAGCGVRQPSCRIPAARRRTSKEVRPPNRAGDSVRTRARRQRARSSTPRSPAGRRGSRRPSEPVSAAVRAQEPDCQLLATKRACFALNTKKSSRRCMKFLTAPSAPAT